MAAPPNVNLAEWLRRWRDAGLIDADTAAAITAFEAGQADGVGAGPGWALRVVLAVGAVSLGAGVLLFVSAHWEAIAPAGRFALVLALVAGLHGLGVRVGMRGLPALATALHGVGTVAFGAGVHLTGQIFHLAAHWPLGLLLWSLGAAAGWALLRQWPQLVVLALVAPAWLAAEWFSLSAAESGSSGTGETVLAAGGLLLALAYLGAARGAVSSPPRRVLLWLGGLALGPASLAWLLSTLPRNGIPLPSESSATAGASPTLAVLGWTVATGGPLLLGWWLRGPGVWPLGVALGWMVAGLAGPVQQVTALRFTWWALGGVLLALWGAREERPERINLGFVAVGLTMMGYYVSEVFDKLGRSASLIGLGVVLLLGGWLLERLRRRLLRGRRP
ncbi:MAG: DUF2157 domain-containing protein [Cyanobacteria bacterium K_Offshore_surface_m2_239]|nr:DUF2157 domain-containing protein [Cyanobacteria bacterium K_Offshore_surface_m2_239]